jgi:hypothetical protein
MNAGLWNFDQAELIPIDFARMATDGPEGMCALLADLNPNTGVISKAPPPFLAQLLPQHFAYWDDFSIPIASMDRPEVPLQTWRLRNVCVTGREGAVVFPTGHCLGHSLDFGALHEPDSNFQRTQAGYLLKSAPTSKIADPCFLGYRAGYRNYAHWMLEHSVFLHAYVRHFSDAGVKLLLPEQLNPNYRQLLDLFRISPSSVIWLGPEPVIVDDLMACDVGDPELQPSIAREVFALLRAAIPVAPVMRRGLFVSRTDAHYRPLLNEAELSEALAATGVEIFAPGQHSLSTQAAAFASSRVIIGGHGAGLSNIVFCRPGTIVLELMPEYCLCELYYRTAAACDLAYGFVSGTSFNNDIAHLAARQGENWGAAWVISVESVMREVEKILESLPEGDAG